MNYLLKRIKAMSLSAENPSSAPTTEQPPIEHPHSPIQTSPTHSENTIPQNPDSTTHGEGLCPTVAETLEQLEDLSKAMILYEMKVSDDEPLKVIDAIAEKAKNLEVISSDNASDSDSYWNIPMQED